MDRLAISVMSSAIIAAAAEPINVPSTMAAAQASGIPCAAPDWTCIAVNSKAPVPSPGNGQLLVKMFGASVNPLNVDLVEPRCKLFPPTAPFKCSNGTLGGEGAGVVAALGDGCPEFKVGDEVWGFLQGAYAEYALGTCAMVQLKPKSLNFVDAGTIPAVGLTSLECLKSAGGPWKPDKNITVVVTGGQGGTGFIGIQLAKMLGATRVITSASGAGIDMVKDLHADVAIDFHQQELFDALPDNSVDVVYDNIGFKGTADKAMRTIRSGGVFLLLTGGGGGELSKNPKPGVRQEKFGSMSPTKDGLDFLKDGFDSGFLRPHTFEAYGLSKVPDAFSRSLHSGLLGKLAIVPNENHEGDRAAIIV